MDLRELRRQETGKSVTIEGIQKLLRAFASLPSIKGKYIRMNPQDYDELLERYGPRGLCDPTWPPTFAGLNICPAERVPRGVIQPVD